LPRPRTLSGRWRTHAARLYINRRRLGLSLACGTVAAVATAALLTGRLNIIDASTGPAPPSSATSFDAADADSQPGRPAGPTIPSGSRLLALDRDSLRLPVTVDDELEILGLVPDVTAMRSEVVSDRARVVAATEDVVLVLLTRDEAHRAAEIEAIGQLVVLGLD